MTNALHNLLKSLTREQLIQILEDSGYGSGDITTSLFMKVVNTNQYQYQICYEGGCGSVFVQFNNDKLSADF